MIRKLLSVIFILISSLTIITVSSCTDGDGRMPITTSQHTIISPILEEPIKLSDNLIYCMSFQMAWNIMRDKIIKGDIKFEPDTLLAKKLNRQLQGNNDISPESYVAVAGEMSKEFLAEINTKLQGKFGNRVVHGASNSQTHGSAQQLIAYAYLYKNLEFQTEFERLDAPITFTANGHETLVKGFGVHSFSQSKQQHKKISDQVAIYDYKNENDFVILLTSKLVDDQIILAKVAPNKTLYQTYTDVVHRISKSKASELRNDEPLKIPIIDFDLNQSFSELENKRIANNGWDGWFISKANQDIRFKLDEKGAVLKSRAFVALMDVPPPQIEKPRKFIFDKPFLICLKQKKGDSPYFAMWVSNAELFIKK